MKLTYNIVYEFLKPYLFPDCVDANVDKEFSTICLFPTHSETYNTDTLYFSTISTLENCQDKLDSDHFIICTGSVDEYHEACMHLKCYLFFIPDNHDAPNIFNELQSLSMRLERWGIDLHRMIESNGTFQDILDISEPFFSNPIFIMDYSLRLSAYTKHIPVNNKDLQETIEKGYFPFHMVKGLVARNLLERIENTQSLSFYSPPNFINCTMIMKAYKPNVANLNTICLYGVISTPMKASMDYMRFLVETIELRVQNLQVKYSESEMYEVSMIIDCIKGHPVTPEEIESKADLVHFSYRSKFRLYLFSFSSYTFALASYMLKEVKYGRPHSVAFIYNQSVVVLGDIGKVSNSLYPEKSLVSKRELNYLNANKGFCGVSPVFGDFGGLHDAYIQAKTAIAIGANLNPEARIHFYHDYYIYHIISSCSREIDLHHLFFQPLNLIIENDRARSTDNMKLLEIYLNNDRSITITANKLHLHRNSIIYRLEKIKQMLGVSFDDPDFRLQLIISFKILHYLEKIQQRESDSSKSSEPNS